MITRLQRLAAVAAVCGAVLVHIATQFSVIFLRPGWSIGAFRGFYEPDQLSYLSIAANAAQGQFGSMEPFTETGSIYYPRAYYLLLGAIAQVTGISPSAAWAIGGLVCQILLVAALAIVCIVVSGRAWVGLLAPLPFVLGTMSWVADRATWQTPLGSHAVLWGPFAVLFPLNAESAGLCLGSIAILGLLIAYLRVTSPRTRAVLAIAASAVVGSLANVQTYSFISATFIVAFSVAGFMVTTHGGRFRWPIVASLAGLVLVLLLGPVVAGAFGPLAALIFGLLPAAPGLVLVVIKTRGLAAVCAAVAVASAAPSVLSTLNGLREHDPFLVYRVASSANLGVPAFEGIIASLAVTIPLVLVLAAGVVRKNPLWISFPIASLSAWALLATNDLWGANQEPYRFWIDCFLLIAVALLPIAISVVRDLLSAQSETPRVLRRVAIAGLVVTVLAAGASAGDWRKFYSLTAQNIRLIPFDGPREQAIAQLTSEAQDELIVTDDCISPVTVKIVSGAPVAYMNVGMAWPTQKDAVDELHTERGAGRLDLEAAREVGVTKVLTDSSCDSGWPERYSEVLSDPRSETYSLDGTTSTLTLWSFE